MKKEASILLSFLSLLSLGCASQGTTEPDQALTKGPVVVTAGVGGVT